MSEKYKNCILHNDEVVKGFFGEYRFLSNFHICDVWFEGEIYPSSEHAYMAAKTDNLIERLNLIKQRGMSCVQAKQYGQTITLKNNWDQVKYDYMLYVVFSKFFYNRDIRERLLATGDKYLEETNNWMDSFWGYDLKKGGENNLGKILTTVRTSFRRTGLAALV